MTKEIPLTKGKVAIVDKDDYEELSRFKWYYTESGYAARDARNTDRTSGKVIYMHKYIMPSKYQTDHVNRDSLDNRKSNLRIATNADNTANRGRQSNNTSGYKGVSWSKVSKKWAIEIGYNNKRYRLGLMEDKEDAARLYNFWASDIHGEFANLNEINGVKYRLVTLG